MIPKFNGLALSLTLIMWIGHGHVAIHVSAAGNSDFAVASDEQLAAGKEKYEFYKREAQMPRYSKCWVNALNSLEFGCRHLTDDIQYRLALQFANCFSMKTGRPTFECSEQQEIEECVKDMADQSYGTLREFFTHTQSMCYFLQSQAWQAETDQTITRLADNSAEVAKQLEDSSELQGNIIIKQNESIKNQEIMIQRGIELRHTIEESAVDVNTMLKEFKDATTEQRTMIFEVFDRVSSLQRLVMGEFTGFYSLIFYTISIIICYMLTSTPRSSGARFWLFAVMTVNIVAERLLCWGAGDSVGDGVGEAEHAETVVYRRLWWCRKMFTMIAVGIWLWFAIRFKDYNKINHQLLTDIKKQNSDLKYLLQHTSMNTSGLLANGGNALASPGSPLEVGSRFSSLCFGEEKDETDGNAGSISGYYTDSGSSSSDSEASDHTFYADRHGELSDSDDESFMTGSGSRRGSRETTPALLDELRDLREATPLREMGFSSFTSPNQASTPKKKVGRPKGSKNKNHSANVSMSERPGLSHYNLRHRRNLEASQNPMINSESAEDFAKTVKHLARVAIRNNMKTRFTLERRRGATGGPDCFSSDEN